MKRLCHALLLALPLALSACGQSSPSPNSQAVVADDMPAVQAPSLAAARKYAKGFDTGNLMSARQVFVFFDPQCPHCGHFWSETKALSREARFTWVPVGLLNPNSTKQATALLAAGNPVEAMDDHENRLLRGQGGMDTAKADPAFNAAVERNTRLLASFGATGVPFFIAENPAGETVSEARGMSSAELAVKLGWKPAGAPAAAVAAGAAAVSAPGATVAQ